MNWCEWFVDNKLSFHLGKDKNSCILFGEEKFALAKHNIQE